MSTAEHDLVGAPGVITAGGPLSRSVAGLYAWLKRRPLARVYDVITLLGVALVHRSLGAKFLHAPFGFDEHYFLHEGWSLFKGMVPYRDFQEFKPPAIFFVNALGIKLFGLDGLAYRQIFSLLSLCSFLAVTFALLSRRVHHLFVGALLVLLMDHFFDPALHDSSINNAETLGLDFFLIGTAILLFRTRMVRTQQFVGAAVLTLAPLSKEPLVFATIAAWLVLLLLHRVESAARNATRKFALFTIAGAATVAATWLGYMVITHSLSWYIVQLKMTIAYANNYAYQLQWFSRTPEGGEAAASWKRLRSVYVNSAHLAYFVPLLVAPLVLWRRRWLVGMGALATFAAALYGVTIGHGFAPHYFIMAMCGTFFCAIVGAVALDAFGKQSGRPMVRWVAGAWAGVVLLGPAGRVTEEWGKLRTYKSPAAPVPLSEVEFVREHSDPGDRIWTLGDPLVYVYSDRLNAVREEFVVDEVVDYFPGSTDQERLAGELAELRAAPPKLIVFGDEATPYSRKQRYVQTLAMPFIKEAGYIKLNDKFYQRPNALR